MTRRTVVVLLVALASLSTNTQVSAFVPVSHVLANRGLRTTEAFRSFPRIQTQVSPATPASDSDVKDATHGDSLFEGLGKGIIRDYKARLPFFVSDITDGLNFQCLATTLFLFFACLAPAVGFGGLFASATGGAMGTIETIFSTAFSGILYALFAAQPLTIIGSTGPVLAFVATLYHFAQKMNLPFLPLYAWTGLWTSGIMFVASLTSASNLVKYMTRFTDEIFSVLISCIFVVEAVSNICKAFGNSFTKGLLSFTCALAAFSITTTLKGLRKSVYFNKTVRNTVSNFAPTIGVVSASLIARWAVLTKGTAVAGLPSLSLPSVFGTTNGRPWLVPIWDLPVWARWASFIPALMTTVLLFLDQNITVRLVNGPKYKTSKGRRKNNLIDGMHADMLVVSILTAIQSLIGVPWLVAATVRSVSHVAALQKYDEKGNVIGSIEQRVSGIGIHALIACLILFSKPRQLLAQVPTPVLMGLFMYLGASALPGCEMWERVIGIFKDKTIAPKEPWTDKVPTRTTNLFTLIQVSCLASMFWVKESPVGVLFPVIIAMLAPLRFALEKTGLVKKEYMDILDKDD